MVLYNEKRESIVLQVMDIKFLLECYGEEKLAEKVPEVILKEFKKLNNEVLSNEPLSVSLDHITEFSIDNESVEALALKNFITTKIDKNILYTPDSLLGINEDIAKEVLDELNKKKNITEYKKGFHDYNKSSLLFLLGIKKLQKEKSNINELSIEEAFILANMEVRYGINIFDKEAEKNI